MRADEPMPQPEPPAPSPSATTTRIQQCPKKCGRLVRIVAGEVLNAAGAWQDYPHSCLFDSADVRGDNDDSPTRGEELGEVSHG